MLKKLMFILACSYLIISIENVILFIGDDFLFELAKNCLVILFIIIMNSSFHVVLICNNSN